jgi:hypothetical protein
MRVYRHAELEVIVTHQTLRAQLRQRGRRECGRKEEMRKRKNERNRTEEFRRGRIIRKRIDTVKKNKRGRRR